MNHDANNNNQQWQDIVRRLGGSQEEAKAEPVSEDSPANVFDLSLEIDPSLQPRGPRDYTLAEQEPENFHPPEPQPVMTSSPRSLLSWAGVLMATLLWLCTGFSGWVLPWWLFTASLLSFLGGATSLFFLLPKTWAHRNPVDDEDYGDGAKV